MNLVDQIPVLVLHVLEADIPQNTSVIEEDVNTAKVLNSRVNNGVTVLDAVVVGNSLAAGGPDLINDDICGLYDSGGQSSTYTDREGRTYL